MDDKTAHGRLKVGITYQTHLRRIVKNHFTVLVVTRPAPDYRPRLRASLFQLDAVVVYRPWWLSASIP